MGDSPAVYVLTGTHTNTVLKYNCCGHDDLTFMLIWKYTRKERFSYNQSTETFSVPVFKTWLLKVL